MIIIIMRIIFNVPYLTCRAESTDLTIPQKHMTEDTTKHHKAVTNHRSDSSTNTQGRGHHKAVTNHRPDNPANTHGRDHHKAVTNHRPDNPIYTHDRGHHKAATDHIKVLLDTTSAKCTHTHTHTHIYTHALVS